MMVRSMIVSSPAKRGDPVAAGPAVPYAKASLPAKDLKELIAWLRANSNKASAGVTPASYRIVMALFEKETGARFTLIPYRGFPTASSADTASVEYREQISTQPRDGRTVPGVPQADRRPAGQVSAKAVNRARAGFHMGVPEFSLSLDRSTIATDGPEIPVAGRGHGGTWATLASWHPPEPAARLKACYSGSQGSKEGQQNV
jgi:hypothetical protein